MKHMRFSTILLLLTQSKYKEYESYSGKMFSLKNIITQSYSLV